MADDIVTRLREHHGSFRMAVGVNDAFILETIYGEAADEIERLRTLLVHGLTEGYDCKGCDLCEQLKAIHKEAVKNGLQP